MPPGALDRRACEAFERHLPSHPLIDAYRRDPRPRTCRLSDAIGLRAFLGSPLYAEYYRPLGVRHAIVVPVHADRRHVVAFALHRDGPPFRDAERALLECVRPQLGALHRLAAVADARGLGPAGRSAAPRPGPGGLTRREREVVGWVGAGKTNRDIAAILGTSPRTVEKHLEHVYVKLGVETRTAAVLRALPARRPG
ncbi:MAG TPA: LuxR C-terminal-related transcriptional regulator [Burkholderiaceae bacterium]|nr:LuxR C-terminal-related transcriptional regulator [Burkholderiaceae bacterium]